ncbi:MAG TPA: large-conductance mechanosensitive channel protein MscL [bacterium]|nr:large-conductance mechanosensitive channel protein MscL [bacterium]
MGMWKEFKEFAVKGNMVDLAVGIIIGGAFGKVVSSIVSDVLMPPLGYLIGGMNFTDIKIHLKAPSLDLAGKVQEVTINIGNFIQSLVDFTIIAFAVFLMVKAINRLQRKAAEAPAAPPPPTKDQELLTEIRDLLKKK